MKKIFIFAIFFSFLIFSNGFLFAKSNKSSAEKNKMELFSKKTPSIYKSFLPHIQSVGLTTTKEELGDKQTVLAFRHHFNEITSGKEINIENILPKTPQRLKTFTASDGNTYKVPDLLDMSCIFALLQDARDSQIAVRLHLLINQTTTPTYFFYEDYDTAKNLVKKEEMNARLEWYIKTIIEYVINWQKHWSKTRNIVHSLDVISEIFSDDGTLKSGASSMWARLYGDETFAVNAFVYATKYGGENFELCYCDYSLDLQNKLNAVLALTEKIRSAGGKIDQIGITSHLATDWPNYDNFFNSIKLLSKNNLKVYIQNLDFSGIKGKNNEKAIFNAYYNFISRCLQNGAYIYGISFRGFKKEPSSPFVDLCETPLFESDYSIGSTFYAIIKASEDFKNIKIEE